MEKPRAVDKEQAKEPEEVSKPLSGAAAAENEGKAAIELVAAEFADPEVLGVIGVLCGFELLVVFLVWAGRSLPAPALGLPPGPKCNSRNGGPSYTKSHFFDFGKLSKPTLGRSRDAI